MKSKRYRMGLLFAMLAIAIAACSGPSRSASTPVDGSDPQPGGETQQPQATDAPSQVETLMAGELATQTAIASGAQPDAPAATEAGPTAAPATATQIPEDSGQQQDPTAVPPTETPEPTDEPDPEPQVDCSSPYTVQKGDWVWDIGRRCNIHPESIIAANGLVYPYIVYPGDLLILPSNAPPFVGP